MDPVKSVRSLADNQATQQAFSLWSEFKKFAFKGNVIDLAVGVVIGLIGLTWWIARWRNGWAPDVRILPSMDPLKKT